MPTYVSDDFLTFRTFVSLRATVQNNWSLLEQRKYAKYQNFVLNPSDGHGKLHRAQDSPAKHPETCFLERTCKNLANKKNPRSIRALVKKLEQFLELVLDQNFG